MGLTPELDQLGGVLTHAAARQRTREERRRRITGGIAAGLLVFAAMTPSQLERADQPILRLAMGSSAHAAELCDQPRGPSFDADDNCADIPAPQAVR
ncbi:hypothetical protein DVA67_010030 [Solirubrobacter sp. CPCC 204708]|uniref:Uncharacterized protein n=1 Tax=Solirubrobacter deserti TaxID=2282478 RepID=A0ABT4RSF1_9ACTN|nr:hypothetical protein [Solirubrobacter deserti]MBE2316314.1 hypothetical protein [Solirubrobacter deserti]MDA0141521.1 hypothetical protein [Solirubrobacter deserti]